MNARVLNPRFRVRVPRLAVSTLAGLLAASALALAPAAPSLAAPLDSPDSPSIRQATYPASSSAPVPSPIDPDITTPVFSDLPSSVQPGETFTIGVDAAPGAHCAGSITFRTLMPAELPDVSAQGETCIWRVTAPATTSPGVAVIAVEVTRSGQSWPLAGVVYVAPVGEAR